MTGLSEERVNSDGRDSPLYGRAASASFNSFAPLARSSAVGVWPKVRYARLRIGSAGPGRLYITKATLPRSDFRNGSMTSRVWRAASAFFVGVQKSQTPFGSGVFQPWPSSIP